MGPGRDLDVLITEDVMGWKVNRGERHWRTVDRADGQICVGAQCSCDTFNPSTNLRDAWKVVEKMRDFPIITLRNLHMMAYCYNRTYATFDSAEIEYGDESWSEANGEHATPLAICYAALRAIRFRDERRALGDLRQESGDGQ